VFGSLRKNRVVHVDDHFSIIYQLEMSDSPILDNLTNNLCLSFRAPLDPDAGHVKNSQNLSKDCPLLDSNLLASRGSIHIEPKRQALKGHMKVARETMTFIYGDSLDLSGFIDGTGNPEPEQDIEVAVVPDGQPGAGGSFIIAQRWVHDLEAFNELPVEEQEKVFGRTKADSTRLDVQPATSHLAHVELREGKTADTTKPKRDEISRRSTPYAFHDGTVGLYFMAFCKSQAPLRERMRAMYGMDGQVRDRLTAYSNPASGAFYFAPSVETLDAALS